MKWKRGIGILLIIVSVVIGFLTSIPTGAVIGPGPVESFWIILLFMVGVILFATSRQEKSGGLEKLFFKDEKGQVRIIDIMGDLQKEGVPDRMPAEEALKKLREYEKPDMKDTFVNVFMPYIEVARRQRDKSFGKKIVSGSEEDYADRFLKMWDPKYSPLIHGNIVPIPLDVNIPGYVRLRHYTSSSRADRIASSRKFGGESSPRPLDQGNVFVTLASSPVLSQQDFVKKYVITNNHLGEAYVEFIVPESDLGFQTNSRNGEKEYYVKANGVENQKRVYRVLSDVEVVKR